MQKPQITVKLKAVQVSSSVNLSLYIHTLGAQVLVLSYNSKHIKKRFYAKDYFYQWITQSKKKDQRYLNLEALTRTISNNPLSPTSTGSWSCLKAIELTILSTETVNLLSGTNAIFSRF